MASNALDTYITAQLQRGPWWNVYALGTVHRVQANNPQAALYKVVGPHCTQTEHAIVVRSFLGEEAHRLSIRCGAVFHQERETIVLFDEIPPDGDMPLPPELLQDGLPHVTPDLDSVLPPLSPNEPASKEKHPMHVHIVGTAQTYYDPSEKTWIAEDDEGNQLCSYGPGPEGRQAAFLHAIRHNSEYLQLLIFILFDKYGEEALGQRPLKAATMLLAGDVSGPTSVVHRDVMNQVARVRSSSGNGAYSITKHYADDGTPTLSCTCPDAGPEGYAPRFNGMPLCKHVLAVTLAAQMHKKERNTPPTLQPA